MFRDLDRRDYGRRDDYDRRGPPRDSYRDDRERRDFYDRRDCPPSSSGSDRRPDDRRPTSRNSMPEFMEPDESWSALQPRDEKLEKELFSGVSSGINFNKYDDIPGKIWQQAGPSSPVKLKPLAKMCPHALTISFLLSLDLSLRKTLSWLITLCLHLFKR